MAHFEIIVGSVLGATEYVAEALQEELAKHNHQTTLHLQPDLTNINPNNIWLVCTSTHGAGDLPDNIQPFVKQIKTENLSNTSFFLVGLGDSSYDTFCFAAEKIQKALIESGAEQQQTSLCIDVLNHPIPEDIAVEWLSSWISTVSE